MVDYMSHTSSSQIVARIYGRGRGAAFTPKDFTDVTQPSAVKNVLARLASVGRIRRLLRGVYDYPAISEILKGPASPDPDEMARAIARAHGWTILPAGATALNMLGLSTQVPARWEYFSDGPTKRYAWSGGSLIFTRRANKETGRLSPRTALLVQALKTLGQQRVDDAVLQTLRSRFTAKELSRARREARYVTSWVYAVIKRLADTEDGGHA